MNKTFTTIIICLILGCSQKPNSPFNFDNNSDLVFKLQSTKHILPQLIMPYKIELKNKRLIVFEPNRIPLDKPLIHIIDAQLMKYVQGKAISGYGPLEINDAHVYDPDVTDSTIWINSVTLKRLARFNINNTNPLAEEEFRQPENMHLASKVLYLKNGNFLANVSTDAYNFVEFSKTGERIAGYGLKEKIESDKIVNDGSITNNFLISQINKGIFKRDPFSEKYVRASLYTDLIEVFDYRTKEIIQVQGPRNEVPEFQIVGSGTNISPAFPRDLDYGHRDIDFSENYIYNLYGGNSQDDYNRTGQLATTIYLLNKRGNVLARFDLDRSLISIAVDETLGKIYGITTDEEPGIAVFNLPQDLFKQVSQQKTLTIG